MKSLGFMIPRQILLQVRNHVIHVSPESGLVTIAGGKWTTYRAMAEETISAAVKECGLEQKNESQTDGLLLGKNKVV